MSDPILVAAVLFGVLTITLLLKVPVAISLLLSSTAAILFIGMPLELMPQRVFTALDSFPFMAIPFFILAGNLMGSGGISKRLVDLANSLVGDKAGGLAIVSVIACMFFAAISGSGAATTAAIGGIMIPYMVKSGYSDGFSAAVNASAGSIGVIIPPSIPFVTYGVLTETPISEMFTAGIGAGVVIGICIIVSVIWVSKKRGYQETKKYSSKEKLQAFKDAILAILMPVIMLGGIYSGQFTATESSVIAVVYGFIVGFFIYKELSLKDLKDILISSAISTASLLLLIASASVFGLILVNNRIPDLIASAILEISSNRIVLLLLINVMLLILGTFMDTTAALIIVAPIFFPVSQSIGMDPVHFGVMLCSNLAIGQITPPFGVNLFVASGTAKIKLEKIVSELWPSFAAMVAAVLMITYIEPITMGLVNLLMR